MGNTFTDGAAAAAPSAGSTTVSSANVLSRLRVFLAEETADFFTDVEGFRELNAGMRMLFGNIDVLTDTDTLSLVDGTATYALPTNFKRMISARIGQTKWLYPINERGAGAYEYLFSDGSDESEPDYYEPYIVDTTGAHNLRFHKTPDASYTVDIRFYCFPPALVDGGQGPAWPMEWAYVPCSYAAAILLEKDRRMAAASSKMAEFEALKRQYEANFMQTKPVGVTVMQSRDTSVRSGYPVQSRRLPTIP